ncbi:MAG: SGNH/GDSL hydrolase family protein [Clostridia bacterium]|nr:SGNH/GDSL hydrolase family protein [Clostridia bacterium]
MKKVISALIALALLMLAFSGCAAKKYDIVERYDVDVYTDYYWDNSEKVIYHESFLPLSSKEGEDEIEVKLLYTPKTIISVQNFNATKLYEAGKDYRLEDGKLYITKESSIPRAPYDFYYYETKTPEVMPTLGILYDLYDGRFTPLFSNGEIESHMILVSYTYSDEWTGPVPAAKGSKLQKTLTKLKNGDDVTVVCYGDSIAYGADSSYFYKETFGGNWVPYYFDMAMDKLEKLYPNAKINRVKTAQGGTGYQWGLQNCESLVNAYDPDLVILAFGMNDGTISASTYARKMSEIVDKIRKDCPDAEIVLVSTMMPNLDIVPMASQKHADHQRYFAELENDFSGLAHMNMTEIHQYMLTKKLFRDMTGNNINHPNDFLARAYAQVLLKTLEE